MPNDGPRPRCRPIATDGEAVLVLVHVGVRADRQVQVLPEHSCRRRQDRIGVGERSGLSPEPIQEVEPCFTLAQRFFRQLAVVDVDGSAEPANDLAALRVARRLPPNEKPAVVTGR